MAGAPAHNRDQQTDVVCQIRPPLQRRRNIRQWPESDDGEGTALKGDARYRELNARLLAIAATLGVGLGESDIRKTIETVRQLSDDVKARSERLS